MRYARPKSRSDTNEVEVQAEFYRRCRNAGIECHLQYRVKGARFDCIIVRGDTIVAVVEVKGGQRVKPSAAGTKTERNERYQDARYRAFSVPVVWVRGFDGIERGFAEVQRIIKARAGGGWQQDHRSASDGDLIQRSHDLDAKQGKP